MNFNLEAMINCLWIGTIAGVFSTIAIQKFKEAKLVSNKYVLFVFSILFDLILTLGICRLFTDMNIWNSLFTSLVCWIGADSIYKGLEKKGLLKGLSEIKKDGK